MSEGNTSEDLCKSRSVLGDLTNRLGKRGISERGKIGIEGFGLNDKDKVKRTRISPRQFTSINSLKHNVVSSISKVSNENRDPNGLDTSSGYSISKSLADIKADSGDSYCLKGKNVLSDKLIAYDDAIKDISTWTQSGGNAVSRSVDELGAFESGKRNICEEHVCTSRENSADVRVEANEGSADSFHNDKNYDVDEAVVNLTQSDLNYENDSDDHNADGFVMSQSGSIDCTILSESQESRVFGVEKSTEMNKGDACANMSGFVDSIKACSCSFCTKAAHIWLDLNYQDIKARVSAMTRIQKEAIILAERVGKSKITEKYGAESSIRVASLESNLRQQWRALFQHMAGIWEKEGNQLEASLLPVSDLREKLKTELELIATQLEKN